MPGTGSFGRILDPEEGSSAVCLSRSRAPRPARVPTHQECAIRNQDSLRVREPRNSGHTGNVGTNGAPRPAVGFGGVESRESYGSEGGFFGSFPGLSDTFPAGRSGRLSSRKCMKRHGRVPRSHEGHLQSGAYCRFAPKAPTIPDCSKMPAASAWPGP